MSRRPGLILARDLARVARPWTTTAVRWLPVTVVGLIMVAVLASTPVEDVSDVSRLGRTLFRMSFVTLSLLAITVPTLQVLRAVQAERESGTLELIALTGIRPGRLLAGVVGARVLTSAVLIGAALPLLMLVPSLGGVGLDEVVLFTAIVATLFGVSVALTALLGLAGRGVAVVLVAIAGFWLCIGLLVPIRLFVLNMELFDVELVLTPLGHLSGATTWHRWPTFVPFLVPSGVALGVAGWTVRRAVAEGWDVRRRAWPGPRWGWLGHALFVLGTWGVEELILGVEGPVGGVSTTVEGALFFLAIAQLTSVAVLYVRTMAWLLPRLHLSGWRLRVPVFGRGVLWRELVTNAQGGLSRVIAIATAAWTLVAVLLIVQTGGEELVVLWCLIAVLLVLSLSLVLVITGILDERARGTLRLVVSTTCPTWAIVRDKLLASTVRLVPLLGMVMLVLAWVEPELLGLVEPPYHPPPDDWVGGLGEWVLTAVPGVRPALGLAWAVSLWVALLALAMTLALAIRPRGLAGTVAAVVPGGLVLLHLIGLSAWILLEGLLPRWMVELAQLLLPMLAFLPGHRHVAGVPVGLVLAAGLWTSIALVAGWAATRAMAKWGTRR